MKNTSISIRKLGPADLPFCRHLVAQAGWNQVDTDWLRALGMEPEGCFLAEIGGIPAGTTTTCRFGTCAWIAMVLVDPQFRNRGVAKQLLTHALAYLEARKVTTVRLDATALGQGLYEQMGFKPEYQVIRLMREESPVLREVENAARADSGAIAALDLEITGTDRKVLLEKLLSAGAPVFYQIDKHNHLQGCAFGRQGVNAFQIGPVLSLTPEAGIHLLNKMAGSATGKLCIDIPEANLTAMHWAESNGFQKQRSFVRMYLGKKIIDFGQHMYATFGPEKG